mgnify:CR=1 FL=1
MTDTSQPFSLHQVFSIDGWNKAKNMVSDHDRVLFLQDACYLLQQPVLSKSDHLYGRHIDSKARNISPYVGIELIDDEQWLELAEHAKNILSW